MTRRSPLFLLLVAAAWAAGSPPAAADPLRIGGTGGAIGLMTRLAKPFLERSGTMLEVVPSLGSGGGIRAAAEGAIDIAVAGRALSDAEKAQGLTEAALLRTPFVFATSSHGPAAMTAAEIAGVYANPVTAWPDGIRIKVILRPKAEDDNAVMARHFPGIGEALAAARARGELPIATTDLDNAALAEGLDGSFIGATYMQMVTERRDLRLIAIDGVAPALDTLESGRYRYDKMLRIVVRTPPSQSVQAFLRFLHSDAGVQALRDGGCIPGGE
jgi:phosphate transport system substrate-binding protein